MGSKVTHRVETTYINSWVESGVYSLIVNLNVAAQMRRLKVDLIDINHVLRTGAVMRSDMVEHKGLWNVRGRTTESLTLEIVIAVVSSQCEVELLRIIKVERSN